MLQFASNTFGLVTSIFPWQWKPFTPMEESNYWPHKVEYFNPGLTQKIWSISSKHLLLNALLRIVQVALTVFSLPIDALFVIPTGIVGTAAYNTCALFANLLLLLKNKAVQLINHRREAKHTYWQHNANGWYTVVALSLLGAYYAGYKRGK